MFDKTLAYGLTFSIPSDDAVISVHLRNSGEFARVESDLIIDYVKAAGGGTYIDVGGNIGTIALPVAAALPESRVVAVEAQRYLAGILAANAVQNNLHNMSVIHAAAGAERGLMAFPQIPPNSGRRSWNYGILGLQIKGVEELPKENVRVCTLDEIAGDDTRFVKVDVEGAEPDVLQGAERLIREVRPCWLLEADRKKPEIVQSCMATFSSTDYDLFWFYAPFVTPKAGKLPRQKENWDGDMNFLAVPAELGRNLWSLERCQDADGSAVQRRAFGYLRRYGFTWRDA